MMSEPEHSTPSSAFVRLLIPPESRRGQLFALTVKSWRIMRQAGARNFARRLWRKFQGALGLQGNGYLSPAKYQRWFELTEAADIQPLRSSSLEIASAVPIVSFILNGLDPRTEHIRDTVRSVLAQDCRNWELRVGGGKSSGLVRELLQGYDAQRSQARIQYADDMNQAITQADGEFVVFLNPGDTVSSQLTHEVACRLKQEPDADIVYFDEDVLSADGKVRQEPFFKPDWSPELLLSVNYLKHSAVRRALANAVGFPNAELDAAEHWDFMFRCSEQARRIEHIPKLLYHCRRMTGQGQDDVTTAQLRSVESHCRRIGMEDASASCYQNAARVVWPASGRKVSIIIPTKDKVNLLACCVNSILQRTSYKNYEIILVDNNSREDATLSFYRSLRDNGRVRIVDYPAHFNYSTANNLGVRNAAGDLLLFLNNDTEVLDADWLDELVRWSDRPQIGVIGPKLLYANRTVQHAGVILGMESFCGHLYRGVAEDHRDMFGSLNWYRDYQAVTGACLMMRREVFEQVGGFDEGYRLGFGDIEICLRVRQHGYRVVYTPFARLFHHEGRTRFNHVPVPDLRRAYRELRTLVEAGDPYFNPNLSYVCSLPTLVEPNEESCRERLRRVMRECGTVEERAAAA